MVKFLNKETVTSAILEKIFTEKIGKVKCCKVSRTIECEDDQFSCRSNGYGFVNFETKELLEKAIAELDQFELEGEKIRIEKYNKDLKKESKFNNLYVRGFDENFTEEQLIDLFKPFGELGSVKLMVDSEGKSRKFGFVCFVDTASALDAVEKMHGSPLEGENTLYVAKFEKKEERWNALKKSLAKTNLYVRNFDKNVTEEDLKIFFGGDEIVRNVKIMTTEVNREDGVHRESKQFGFVSFNTTADAANVIQKSNTESLEFNNKQLYVNYYEDKETRKKRMQNNKKDNLMGIFDQSMNGASGSGQNNMMEYFMKVFTEYFNNVQNQGFSGNQYGGGHYNNNRDHYQHYNRRGQRNHRGYGGQSYNQYSGHHHNNMYNRPPRQDIHNSYANAPAAIPQTAPPMVGTSMPPAPVPTQIPVQAPPTPIQTPPISDNNATLYAQTVEVLIKGAEFNALDIETKREKIGEEIYNYVLDKAGDESAPKITGMIIDLPFDDLINSVQSWKGLQEKIQEGLVLLQDDK